MVTEPAQVVGGRPVAYLLRSEPSVGGNVVDVWPVRLRAGGVDRPARENLAEPVEDSERLAAARDALIEVAGDHGGYVIIKPGQQVLQTVEVVQVLRPRLGIAASAAHVGVLPGDADPDDAHRPVGQGGSRDYKPATSGARRPKEAKCQRKARPDNDFASAGLLPVAPVATSVDGVPVVGQETPHSLSEDDDVGFGCAENRRDPRPRRAGGRLPLGIPCTDRDTHSLPRPLVAVRAVRRSAPSGGQRLERLAETRLME